MHFIGAGVTSPALSDQLKYERMIPGDEEGVMRMIGFSEEQMVNIRLEVERGLQIKVTKEIAAKV